MDNRPIGVFDSGLGGLTAVKQIASLLPGESVIYFGDTGRVPYGTRSRQTILQYTREAIAFLKSQGVKRILVACGTASTVLEEAAADAGLPVTGVITAACRKAVMATKNQKIGLIATSRSIRSGLYEKNIAALLPGTQVESMACPLLVPVIENGRIGIDDPVTKILVSEYLAPIKAQGVDTLILGCTHYPIIRDIIQAEMGPDVTLVDAGAAAASELREALRESGTLSPSPRGELKFFVSDIPEGFATVGSVFLGRSIGERVEKVSIQHYIK